MVGRTGVTNNCDAQIIGFLNQPYFYKKEKRELEFRNLQDKL